MSATIKKSVAALLLALLLIVFCAAPALALGTPKAVAYAPGKEPEAEQQKMTDEESALYYAKLYARYYSPFTAPAVRPLMKYLEANRNITSSGSTAQVLASISAP